MPYGAPGPPSRGVPRRFAEMRRIHEPAQEVGIVASRGMGATVRVILQRVAHASVRVDGSIVGGIGPGALLLVGIGRGDGEPELEWMARKIAGLRVFPDEEGRMNRSVLEAGGSLLSVSQFTLYGDCRKGRRPSFVGAEDPDRARGLHDRFVELLREQGVSRVETGRFGAMMSVELLNDGPVTLILESPGAGEG